MRNNYAEISRSNIHHNIDVIRSGLRPETKYLAVVKANAYGHGMEIVANAAREHGADYLAVAIAEEGERLRRAGIAAPILLLGATDEAHMDTVLEYSLIPTFFTVDALLTMQQHAAAKGVLCRFHFKVDTGMNRIGFKKYRRFLQGAGYPAPLPEPGI